MSTGQESVDFTSKYTGQQIEDFLDKLARGAGGNVHCTVEEYNNMPVHYPDVQYFVYQEGDLQSVYIGSILFATKTPNNGFPYTFPFQF